MFLEFISSNRAFSPSSFAEVLPKELLSGFATMVMADTGLITEDIELTKKEFELVVRELEIVDIHQRLEALGAKIRQFEEREEKDKLVSSQKKFSILAQKLAELEEREEQGIILH